MGARLFSSIGVIEWYYTFPFFTVSYHNLNFQPLHLIMKQEKYVKIQKVGLPVF